MVNTKSYAYGSKKILEVSQKLYCEKDKIVQYE